jgi:hypothetical protein
MDHEEICENLITKRFARSPDHEEICEKLRRTIQCRHPMNLKKAIQNLEQQTWIHDVQKFTRFASSPE